MTITLDAEDEKTIRAQAAHAGYEDAEQYARDQLLPPGDVPPEVLAELRRRQDEPLEDMTPARESLRAVAAQFGLRMKPLEETPRPADEEAT